MLLAARMSLHVFFVARMSLSTTRRSASQRPDHHNGKITERMPDLLSILETSW
jgi:hypothetical protein